jgi:peptidyl-prolyl cis-trans isomerase D
MLEFLRKAAQTWVAKLLLILLMLSFGIWGVSHSLVAPTGTTVVTVGDQSIGVNEFRLAYQRQVSQLSRQFGMQLTPDQARAFGVDQQVYSQLAAGAALDQLSADMKLGLSEDRLASLIAEDPAFKSVNGQFDRTLYTERLRNAGLQSDDYITERSKVAVRSQIVESISDGFAPPKTLVDALKQYRDESRSIDYLLLTNANIDPVKAPGDDVLGKWFEGAKNRFRAPEYRKIAYVKLEAADIAKVSAVTDEAVRADFDKRKDSYRTPDSRTIEQLTFPNKEMAQAASSVLRSGATTFDKLVTDQGKTASDVLLGQFTKDTLPDAKVADAAFAIKQEGGTTPVIDGSFGPVIIRATNIKPETTKTFDEVKEQIRKDIALSDAGQEVASVHDRYEELRASGSSLEDAAKELKLATVVVDVDATGKDPQGNEIKTIPAAASLLPEAFKADAGGEPLPINLGRDGYLWYEIRGVTPEREQTLAEVRDAAVADWTAEQQKATLATFTETLKQRVNSGETLATIASELGISVETKSGLHRNAEDPVLGRGALAAAFAGPNGTVGSALGEDNVDQILLKVTEVNDQPTTTDVLASNNQQLDAIAKAAGDDILDQMVNRLQTEYGVSINQSVADQAMLR